jgi:low temperature requirement protein LtrA
LFFDLVFVFAITEVTSFLTHNQSWRGLLDATAILMVLWFVWSGYVWLGNVAGTDEGAMRVVLLVAVGPMLVAGAAVPHAFGKDALAFGIAVLVVHVLHLSAFTVVSRGDAALRAVVGRLAWPILTAGVLLAVAGALSGGWRAGCWIAVIAIEYGGLLLGGTDGWRVEPSHFAERHRLIVIIALGESIVAIGVGTAALTLDAGVIVGALLGAAVVGALWWAYFDVVAFVAERVLRRASPHDQALIARDSYTYLHLPMVAGIVVFAFGVKTTLTHVHAHLHGVAATALCGGVALYLVALSTLKRRNVGTFNTQRLVAAAVLVALAPVATVLPALVSLAAVAAVACSLIVYEATRYAAARDRIRHS